MPDMDTSAFPYTSKPHKPLPSDPQARSDVLRVLERGYIILENQFPPHAAHSAKVEIDLLSGQEPESGRNPFEGLKTSRIYGLLNKTREFDKFVTLERVMRLNDWFLDPNYIMTAFHTIKIDGGSAAQPLHHDDAFTKLPRPRFPLGTGIIIALDDFTATNGATQIIPGSHLFGNKKPAATSASKAVFLAGNPEGISEVDAVPAVCPAGSVVFFISTTWHSGGANLTPNPRYSLTVQYCQPWMRQIENMYLSVDLRKLDNVPKEIVRLMGFGVFEGFIGNVDGLSPREAARRQAAWMQKPVNWRPPTFAHHADSKL